MYYVLKICLFIIVLEIECVEKTFLMNFLSLHGTLTSDELLVRGE